jgi:solute carrier family 8 (sodium/calcium exchanger)
MPCDVCRCGRENIFIAGVETPNAGWAILYTLILLYLFLGVTIGSDVFMNSIERITAMQRTVLEVVPGEQDMYKKKKFDVWNATVANLSLMALGSSAPEILLSVIEVFLEGMFAGPLGPSTIVGSAAFNLMCIPAVCVMALPAGESKKVESAKVYACTAITSLLAYGWLFLVLSVIPPSIVEVWEAVVTFLSAYCRETQSHRVLLSNLLNRYTT